MGANGWLCLGLCNWCWPGRFVGRMVVFMTDRKIMKLSLEALATAYEAGFWELQKTVVSALRERLAQPEQEPAGTVKELFTQSAWERLDLRGSTKVYLDTSPQRKPLTDEKIWELAATCLDSVAGRMQFARAIEAAHGIFKDEK